MQYIYSLGSLFPCFKRPLPQEPNGHTPKTGTLNSKDRSFFVSFDRNIGVGFLFILAALPTTTLLAMSTNIKSFVGTVIVAGTSALLIKKLWNRFEESNIEKMKEEQKNIKELENRLDLTILVKKAEEEAKANIPKSKQPDPKLPDPMSLSICVTNMAEALRRENTEKAITRDEDNNNFWDRQEYLNNLTNKFKKYSDVEFDNHFIQIQKFNHELNKVIEGRLENAEKNKNLSELIKEAKSLSNAFKAMSLVGKISKIEKGFKLIEDELIKSLSNSIALSKNSIEIFIVLSEYSRVFARKDLIRFLKTDIEKLKTLIDSDSSSSPFKDYFNSLKQQEQDILRSVITNSINTLELRKKHLKGKNQKKLEAIRLDIFEAILNGTQDLLELVCNKTDLFSDSPDILENLLSVNTGLSIAASLFTLFVCSRKFWIASKKSQKGDRGEKFYKEKLKQYFEKKPEAKSNPTDSIDTYAKFLELKIEAIHKTKKVRLFSLAEKIVKFIAATLTLGIASESVLISSGIAGTAGILIGAPIATTIGTAATFATLCTLSFSVIYLLSNLYLQRHRISYGIQMIYHGFAREFRYKALCNVVAEYEDKMKKYKEYIVSKYTIELSKREMERILNENGIYNESYLNYAPLPAQDHYNSIKTALENEISKFKTLKNQEDTIKNLREDVDRVTRVYNNTINKIQNLEKNCRRLEMADKVQSFSVESLEEIEKALDKELDDDFEQAAWRERLSKMGYILMVKKPLTGSYILSLATGKNSPVGPKSDKVPSPAQ